MDLETKDFGILKALLNTHQMGRLGHTLLFKTSDFSWREQSLELLSFMKSILCLTPQELNYCGNCESCRSFDDSEEIRHPDFQVTQPQNQTGYSVEQVREIIKFFSLKKALSPKRILWIQNAEQLTQSSGNALLKFLEEPQNDVYIFLSSSNSEKILATILSRCHSYHLPTQRPDKNHIRAEHPQWEELFRWLEQGAPAGAFNSPADLDAFWAQRKEALEEVEEIFRCAWLQIYDEMNQFDLEQSRRIYDFFNLWQESLIRMKAYGNPITNWIDLKSACARGDLWRS